MRAINDELEHNREHHRKLIKQKEKCVSSAQMSKLWEEYRISQNFQYKFILSMIMLSSLILAFLITHSYISLVYNNCFGIKV